LCLSKGISGGYLPLSLVMTRDDIYQSFTVTNSHAVFCIRIRTPATPWLARQHWRPWRFLKKMM
jgi:hypothetical protein